ncbi:Phospho-N-acetylmuramoyl-pentapeptide-transferase [Candidatus Methanobinarius endosymbioticus]|uniref:Phospho-N-acetylmuramoyl-pentapeptide-transferase n=1 Tax=Candidatus Methanobinarius endosymbioticus TaxID=2006182 RepID=A0A366MDJ9_9EURY|nr:Phospho-N-acetylmuramoyl-pentapeptide-transferase [Candidatus Methanobinarius endosymbioticus]
MTILITNPSFTLVLISTICGILGFFVTRLTMPRLIKKLENANIIGKDMHKSAKPIVAEMGGIGILFGFVIGIFAGIYLHPILTFQLSVVLIVILLVGIIGMVDDLLTLSSKEKFILLFLAGIPLIWIAPPNVGLLYLILIPIAVSIVANLTNMLAGLNGIESGLGVIAMTSLTISCIILGKYDVAIISMSMLGVLVAFLLYNKYPSSVFPGDTGTLIIGATIAAIAFIGRIKLIAFIVLIPNIIDAAMKFYSAGVMERQQHRPTEVNDDGKLIIPDQGFKSLIRLVLKKPINEKDAVKIIWGIGIVFGILGIIVAIIMPEIIRNTTLAQFIKYKDVLYYVFNFS